MRRYNFNLNSVDATSDNIQLYDCIVVGTDHEHFDYNMIRENAKLIVDTRGKYRGRYDNVVHA